MPSPSPTCAHARLRVTPYPSQTRFPGVSPHDRAAAAAPTVLRRAVLDCEAAGLAADRFAATFPGPLGLEGDDLVRDPEYPPQSFREWRGERQRNKVGAEGRRTIYVVGPPVVEDGAQKGFMRGWTECDVEGADAKAIGGSKTNGWEKDVVEYLEAFYHGLPVKLLNASGLHFTPWDTTPSQPTKSKSRSSAKARKPKEPLYIGLRTADELIGIRYRATPSGHYSHQLNLDDLLDAAISILPDDAYALLMLADHDLYEDDDDEFVCGRAYGGSRVAVVSRARYNPLLDEEQGVPREHAWPASHCEKYMAECCGKAAAKMRSKGVFAIEDSPLRLAVTAHTTLYASAMTSEQLAGLWFSRICRTASHELGHCFGIDHCVYYACCMQGSASIVEDARQPPYLCPVDLQKVVRATGADVAERYRALRGFCAKWEGVCMFAAWGKWVEGRLKQTEDAGQQE
jgi:archaemetzincin